MSSSVRQLVESLPELYQPVYGHPEYRAARQSDEQRIDAATSLVQAVTEAAGRPLRVLDLGSSQGYLSLRIAELGHHVTGIDVVPANVRLATALAAEHPELDVRFVEGEIAEIEHLVDLSSFDVVCGFSVLHHLVHRDGNDVTAALVARLATAIPHALVEMALATEPLYWAASLPRDPRHTIAAYPFCRQVATSTTHLSDVARPVMFCSTTHVLVNGKLVPFDSWTDRSHDRSASVQIAAARYFRLDGAIAKTAADYSADTDTSVVELLRDDLRRESHMLQTLEGVTNDVPNLIEFADAGPSSILVRATVPGELLSTLLPMLSDEDRSMITSQVLARLADLERIGLHHSDLRSWNVVVDLPGGTAHLIDFGAIRTSPTDVVWPNDAHFSLLLFLAELWSGRPIATGEHLPRSLDIDGGALPAVGVRLICRLLAMVHGDQVATRLLEEWPEIRDSTGDAVWPRVPLVWSWLVHQSAGAVWARQPTEELSQVRADLALLEEECAELHVRCNERERQLEDECLAHRAVAARADELSQSMARRTDELHALWFEHQAVLADRERIRQDAEQARAALDATHRSISWRLTAPLRRIRRFR